MLMFTPSRAGCSDPRSDTRGPSPGTFSLGTAETPPSPEEPPEDDREPASGSESVPRVTGRREGPGLETEMRGGVAALGLSCPPTLLSPSCVPGCRTCCSGSAPHGVPPLTSSAAGKGLCAFW